MRSDPYTRTVDELSRLVQRADLPDGEYVRRYVRTCDAQAFAHLVRRHGPMVFGVCRRVLANQQDAEDAFQATFLVLARKAAVIRPPEALRRWLYGVAVRVAQKARGRQRQRLAKETTLVDAVAAPVDQEPCDWRPLLDQALLQLPERDRRPILLCDVFGRSRSEAAAELGIPEGTLSSRLARSRDKLRRHLLRLGVTPTVASMAALFGETSAAVVPSSILETTLAAIPRPGASQLAEGVLRTMMLTKLLKLTMSVVCVTLALSAVWRVTATAGTNPPPSGKELPAEPTSPPRVVSDDERIQGTWIVERVSVDGKNTPVGDHPWLDARMTFVGQRLDFAYFPGRPKSFTLKPTTEPKQIDIELRNTNYPTEDGNTHHLPSIYKFDGTKLHLTLGIMQHDERPTSFEWSHEKPPYTHVVLRRTTNEESKQILDEHHRFLQGTWLAVASEEKGKRQTLLPDDLKRDAVIPPEVAPRLPRLHVAGNTLTLQLDAKTKWPFSYTLDPTKGPHHLTLTATTDLPDANLTKGQTVHALYDYFRGVLSVCLPPPPGDVRPQTLATEGTRNMVYFFIRDNDPVHTVGALKLIEAPRRGLEGIWSAVAKEVAGIRTEFKEIATPRIVASADGLLFYRSFAEPLSFRYTTDGNKIDMKVTHAYRETTDGGLHRVYLPDQVWSGLFKQTGDELRLTLAARPDGERPSSLDSKLSKMEVLIFRRDPPDAEAIMGQAWQLLEGEIDPQATLPIDKQPAARSDILRADHFTSGGGAGVLFDGAQVRFRTLAFYRLRPSEKLKEIDLVLQSSSDYGQRGDVIKGIYQLSAKELILVFPRSASRGPRPTSFDIKGTANLKVTLRVVPPRPAVEPIRATRIDELRQEHMKTVNTIRDRLYEGAKKKTVAFSELVAIERVAYQTTRELAKTPNQHITACENAVKRMKDLEILLAAEVKAGNLPELTHLELVMHRLKIEIELAELLQKNE